MLDYLPFLILLTVIAAFLQEDAVLTIFYMVIGVYLASRWWSTHAGKNVQFKRNFNNRVFPEEIVNIQLELNNTGWLPVLWLYAHDSLPVGMITPNFFRQVVSLKGHGKTVLDYQLRTRNRGYYPIGPLFLRTGDFLGVVQETERQGATDYLTVYPRIIPITHLGIPSKSPFGTLRYTQPIYEDPTRVTGKRDYQTGDSLRRVDWKASAILGRLQIKQFEPSISLETVIFLNLNSEEYRERWVWNDTEVAISCAASISNWIIDQKQSVGIITNGIDQLAEQPGNQNFPARKGSGHLMRLLEMLARVQPTRENPFVQLLQSECQRLSWGTTLILITGALDDTLLEALFQTRKKGLNAVIILVGKIARIQELKQRAGNFGYPVLHIIDEKDMEAWR